MLAVLTADTDAHAQIGGEDVAADILAHERALAAAMHARDRSRIEPLLSADYVLRGAPEMDRETWIRTALTLCWDGRFDVEAFRARQQGDVVVAAFALTVHVDPATCRPAVMRSLVTDVWVRALDGWRLSVRHAGPRPQADAGVAALYSKVPQPPPVWDVSSELSLAATGGNTSTFTFGSNSSVAHRVDGRTTRASVAFLTSNADEVTRARSIKLDARHGVRVSGRSELFGRGSFERDRFAGIDARAAAEIGAAFRPSWRRPHTLTAEGSLGFTSERRLDATRLQFLTGTAALRYGWTILPGTELTEHLVLIADLEHGRNWRGTSTTALSVTLTRMLSLKASHALEYRNTPVSGFRRLDLRTTAALVVSFERRPSPPMSVAPEPKGGD